MSGRTQDAGAALGLDREDAGSRHDSDSSRMFQSETLVSWLHRHQGHAGSGHDCPSHGFCSPRPSTQGVPGRSCGISGFGPHRVRVKL